MMKDHIIIAFIIGLLVGGLVVMGAQRHSSLPVVTSDDSKSDMHEHADHGHDSDHSHDEMLMVASSSAPTLSIESARISGANNVDLNVTWENFTMAPEKADGEHVAGEGHLHVYVDGVKDGRMYGQWYHVYDLPAGEHVIEVTATTNDHRLYAVGSSTVTATTSVTIE